VGEKQKSPMAAGRHEGGGGSFNWGAVTTERRSFLGRQKGGGGGFRRLTSTGENGWSLGKRGRKAIARNSVKGANGHRGGGGKSRRRGLQGGGGRGGGKKGKSFTGFGMRPQLPGEKKRASLCRGGEKEEKEKKRLPTQMKANAHNDKRPISKKKRGEENLRKNGGLFGGTCRDSPLPPRKKMGKKKVPKKEKNPAGIPRQEGAITREKEGGKGSVQTETHEFGGPNTKKKS